MAEVGVEGDLVAVAQEPSPVAVDRGGADPAAEDDLHFLRSANVKIVHTQRSEERLAVPGCGTRTGHRTWETLTALAVEQLRGRGQKLTERCGERGSSYTPDAIIRHVTSVSHRGE